VKVGGKLWALQTCKSWNRTARMLMYSISVPALRPSRLPCRVLHPPHPPSLPPAQHTPLHPPCAHTHAQSSCAAASVDEVASLTLTLHSTKVLTEAKQRLCPDSACPSHTAPNSNNSKAEDSYEMQVVPQMTGAETTGNTIRACNTSVLPQPAGYCC
jgi:hypothetical protein